MRTAGTGQANEHEEHDRKNFNLPGQQPELLADVLANARPQVPIVLVLFSAGPLNVSSADSADSVLAILQCTFPAQMAGLALYEVSLIES